MPASPPVKSKKNLGPLCKSLGLEKPGIAAVVGSGGKTALIEALAAELAAKGQIVALSTTTHIYPPPARICGPAWLWGDGIPLLAAINERLNPGKTVAVAQKLNSQGKLKGLSTEQVVSLAASGAWVLVEADGAARKPLKAWAPHEPAWPGNEMLRVVLVGASALGKPLGPERVHRHQEFAQAAGIKTGDEISPQALVQVLLGPMGPFGQRPPGVEWSLVVNQIDAASPGLVAALIDELKTQAGGWLRLLKGKVRWGSLESVSP